MPPVVRYVRAGVGWNVTSVKKKKKKKVRSILGTINHPVRESALNFAIFTFLRSYFNAHLF